MLVPPAQTAGGKLESEPFYCSDEIIHTHVCYTVN